MSKSPSSRAGSGGQVRALMTNIIDAEVLIDNGKPLTELGQALLGRKKQLPRPVPDDRSALDEELTHLFIGDRAACLMVSNAMAQASNGELFGPQCGRSGRNVMVITCKNNADSVVVNTYCAVACHCSSKRNSNNVLQVSKVLLTARVPGSWLPEFLCSYMANANGIDPKGGLPGVPQSPSAGCEMCGSKGSQSADGAADDPGATS